MSSNSYPLNELGQIPGLFGLYTQITFCYPVTDPSSHATIIETLQNGLRTLTESFPWIAGNVIQDDNGNCAIRPLHRAPSLIVKDVHTLDHPHVPTIDGLRKASFPFSMLDEDLLSLVSTVPMFPSDNAPVFLVQGVFVPGGLLLTFVGQHNVMDMTGLGHIITLIDKACREEPFSPEEIASGNLSSVGSIPLLNETHDITSEVSHQIMKPIETASTTSFSAPVPSCSWESWSFSNASLTELKAKASENVIPPLNYISTNDALTAFVWQSVIRARLPRLSSSAKCTLARAVNVRRHLDVPGKYPGLMQNMLYHPFDTTGLAHAHLGTVASNLRAALVEPTCNLRHATRALATHLSRSTKEEREKVSVIASLNPSSDLIISSWAAVECAELDFGLGLGAPEAVRRPRFTPFESQVFLLPKARDGEIVVGMCLREEDLSNLRADEEFGRYARYIG